MPSFPKGPFLAGVEAETPAHLNQDSLSTGLHFWLADIWDLKTKVLLNYKNKFKNKTLILPTVVLQKM